MANIPFKSITFPGLANKYQVPEISDDLMTQGKAADSAKVGAEFDKVKADLDNKVSITAQELTESQKVQARKNIGVTCYAKDGVMFIN